MSDGVVFFPSFHEAIKELPDAERLCAYDAIVNYGLYGEVIEMPPIIKALFAVMKPNIDASQRRHRAAKANGSMPPKDPDRPRGRPPKNQTKNQTENHDIDTDIETDTDIEIKTDIETDTDIEVEESTRSRHGEYGWVLLTDAQYAKLEKDLGKEELDRCIRYVDESAQSSGNKNGWKDWNLVISRCSREGWGRREEKGKRVLTFMDLHGVETETLLH